MEGILSPKLASTSYSEDPFGETLSPFGLIFETEFSPLNGRAEPQFSRIVGGLYIVVGEESKQMGPVFEHSPGSSAHGRIRAVLVFEAIPFHSSPHEDRGILELPTSDAVLAESVPAGKQTPDLLEHVLGEHVGIRTASAVLEGLEFANQM